ncbi:UbiX family flavin prenyltransferase [Neomegalonema sp.]|uniref:UbiX family flavin prenyltransferase n=1 Tax=Neomegalonema sp. TaxID=2039713 RepID=UPI002626956E|nr:UbiX family flavin prenyltransferase [Neomegalonema sp.]MDD2868728.1 UbiX family flavin prenyltransferase [Neomegalonema sp.]
MSARRLVVGVSGASGSVYGVKALEMLRALGVETHLVVSEGGALTAAHELGFRPGDWKGLADHVHSPRNLAASIASGSFRTLGMLVAPCSMRSLAEIATGLTTGLLARAADVTLKERRPLVMLVRETPLHAGHLKMMLQATENGAVIMPPVPAFYAGIRTLDEMVAQTVGRALDLFGLDSPEVRRWGEAPPEASPKD